MIYIQKLAAILVSYLVLLNPVLSEAQETAQNEINTFLSQKETVKEYQMESDIMVIYGLGLFG